jgi:histidine triad (HIT) family protein
LASQRDDCLFCRIVREGPHLAATPGFVAIEDINPQAPVHLLIIPERHLESFREIGALTPAECKQMLEFLAETARSNGLADYRVVANVGRSAGQTVFHLHWHLLGERAGAAGEPTGAAA